MAHIFDGHDVTDLEVLRTEDNRDATLMRHFPRSLFDVVLTAHGEDCAGCMDCAQGARTYASVTGSVGATYRNSDSTVIGAAQHFATVERVWHPSLV
jgi:hypothetical protein